MSEAGIITVLTIICKYVLPVVTGWFSHHVAIQRGVVAPSLPNTGVIDVPLDKVATTTNNGATIIIAQNGEE